VRNAGTVVRPNRPHKDAAGKCGLYSTLRAAAKGGARLVANNTKNDRQDVGVVREYKSVVFFYP